MGMGVDVHGLDYTNAAKRAVFDAIHHSSLGFPRLVGKTADDMRVDGQSRGSDFYDSTIFKNVG